MKRSWKNTLAACLFFGPALVLTGCHSSGKTGAMEDKIDSDIEIMGKEKMNDTMSDSTKMMEQDKMKSSMPESMENMESEKRDKMEKGAMQETIK